MTPPSEAAAPSSSPPCRTPNEPSGLTLRSRSWSPCSLRAKRLRALRPPSLRSFKLMEICFGIGPDGAAAGGPSQAPSASQLPPLEPGGPDGQAPAAPRGTIPLPSTPTPLTSFETQTCTTGYLNNLGGACSYWGGEPVPEACCEAMASLGSGCLSYQLQALEVQEATTWGIPNKSGITRQ